MNFNPENPDYFDPTDAKCMKDWFNYWYDRDLTNLCKHNPRTVILRQGGCSGQLADGRCIYRVEKVPCPDRFFYNPSDKEKTNELAK